MDVHSALFSLLKYVLRICLFCKALVSLIAFFCLLWFIIHHICALRYFYSLGQRDWYQSHLSAVLYLSQSIQTFVKSLRAPLNWCTSWASPRPKTEAASTDIHMVPSLWNTKLATFALIIHYHNLYVPEKGIKIQIHPPNLNWTVKCLLPNKTEKCRDLTPQAN